MGMTIDDADTILSCERLDSSMGCGASDEDIDEALGVAIDTMRKYQKLQDYMRKLEKNGQYGTLRKLKIVLGEVEDEIS